MGMKVGVDSTVDESVQYVALPYFACLDQRADPARLICQKAEQGVSRHVVAWFAKKWLQHSQIADESVWE